MQTKMPRSRTPAPKFSTVVCQRKTLRCCIARLVHVARNVQMDCGRVFLLHVEEGSCLRKARYYRLKGHAERVQHDARVRVLPLPVLPFMWSRETKHVSVNETRKREVGGKGESYIYPKCKYPRCQRCRKTPRPHHLEQ